MGMRLPGGVSDESSFWNLLVNKKDGRCTVPEDRYNVNAFYSPNGGHGTVKTKHGYFLDHLDLHHLDASFFSMNKTEVEKLDPQQRLLLETVWECMENGGQVGWRGKKIGCYVRVFGEDWLDMAAKDTQHLGVYRITGSGDFAISNRISYEYDLRGPRYVQQLSSYNKADSRKYDNSSRLFFLVDRFASSLSGNIQRRVPVRCSCWNELDYHTNNDNCYD